MATLTTSEQALFDTLPASGEVDFDTWRQQLVIAGKVDLMDANYHPMRRAKTIKVELRKNSDGVLTSYISRPSAPTA